MTKIAPGCFRELANRIGVEHVIGRSFGPERSLMFLELPPVAELESAQDATGPGKREYDTTWDSHVKHMQTIRLLSGIF
ncbi:hypothetical protein C447_13327 [Halococcus hamelinensis 100A6]|uniref:Uncharacterized protein n=1 Tax=Halococcus hamelinensis 100A6 TaxID=1132509 RepID=M0LUS1_9EURY|nr:hypothetical protein [Halococcus hamelinensis]EMA37201.1 hypothetical protein C447_13327 [Halococcus hamelinensis 100A6]